MGSVASFDHLTIKKGSVVLNMFVNKMNVITVFNVMFQRS